MCGIAGIVGSADPAACRAMVDAQRHRGPDGDGIRIDPSGRCVLGHARLAILDTSAAGLQPMASPDGRYWIAYNGEVYNYRDLAEHLEADGERFETGTDTEVVLRWIARKGVEGLADLNGMFALAVWDDVEQTLLLARDRFGVKPLYVAELASGGAAFASEVRALLASGLVERRLNEWALRDFLLLGFVLEPRTIVDGIRSLGAGSYLRLDSRGGVIEHGVFARALPHRSVSDTTDESVRDRFHAAVRSQLVSDVPIGAFLSGGVDSSAVVGAMTAVDGFRVETLTVSFPDEPAWDESERAERWAARCGARHHRVPMTGADMVAVRDEALASQDQPTMDGVNTLVVSKAARAAGLTVVLTGLGGDELFGGYSSVRDVPKALRIRRALGPIAGFASKPVAAVTRRWDARPARIVDVLECPAEIPSLYAVRRRVFTPRQASRLLPGAAVRGIGASLGSDMPDDLDPRDAVSWLEASVYMRNQLLRDTDTMGMACSLEIRPPFLDNAFVDAAWRAGPEWRDGKRRFVRALGDAVPADVLDLKKRGFTLPFQVWMTGPLRDAVGERLQTLPEAFDDVAVAALWRRFLERPDAVGWSRPWALFVLAAYLERHGLA